MHSLQSFAETNPEVSESPLFIICLLQEIPSTNPFFFNKIEPLSVQSEQELVLEFKYGTTDTGKLRVNGKALHFMCERGRVRILP